MTRVCPQQRTRGPTHRIGRAPPPPSSSLARALRGQARTSPARRGARRPGLPHREGHRRPRPTTSRQSSGAAAGREASARIKDTNTRGYSVPAGWPLPRREPPQGPPRGDGAPGAAARPARPYPPAAILNAGRRSPDVLRKETMTATPQPFKSRGEGRSEAAG